MRSRDGCCLDCRVSQDARSPHAEEDVAHLLVETGVALGRCNYPSPQAEELIEDVSDAYGADAEVAVLPTMVMAEDRRGNTVALQKIKTHYRFDQIAMVQGVVNKARTTTMAAPAATAELRAIPDTAPLFPFWLRVIGYALAAVGYAMCIRLSFVAIVFALVLGALVGIALIATSGSAQVSALMPILATFCCALAVSFGATQLGVPVPVRLATVPVLMLLPGAALTAAVIELVSGNMIAGSSRLIYAVMILIAMAFSFTFAVQVAGVGGKHLADFTAQLTPVWVEWAGIAVFAVGLMLYFCMPLRFWIPTMVILFFAYSIESLAEYVVSAPLAAGLATAVAVIASWAYNHQNAGGPVSMMIYLPTFWLLVPGAGGFVAITGVMDQNKGLASLGSSTALTILSMAIGTMVAVLAAPTIIRAGHHARHIRD